MENIIFDIETNGINATKIHCLSYNNLDANKKDSLTSYNDMREFLLKPNITLIGHNVQRYDIPQLEKILGIKVTARLIDTLSLSWYIETTRTTHGLESYGEDFGVPKPEIKDWENLDIETYIHRCEEDVKINTLLWKRQHQFLKFLYVDDNLLSKFLNYISFKTDCVREQEEVGVRLDVERCKSVLNKLETEKENKRDELHSIMPKVDITSKKVIENAISDENGKILSVKGDLFYDVHKERGWQEEAKKEIIKVIRQEEPNFNSNKQLKDWLYALEWVPEHYKHVKDKKTEEVRKVPQIASIEGGGEICDSIKKLYDKEPRLELLNGLSVISHRISIFKGFLRDQIEGRLYASISGLTNTLRMQHTVLVNLPGIYKKYGEDIRGCLIADEGSFVCGSDLSGIEDCTKRHYIYKYDPKYVEDMNVPGYDAHLEIAVLAGFITNEDVEFFKKYDKESKKEDFSPSQEDKKRFSSLKIIRTKSKIVNFSATYKVGLKTLIRNSGMKAEEAKRTLDTFWERNKAILQIERNLKIRHIDGKMWLQNPTNMFWYSLRNEKDKFSTLNQGTAVYVFDIWIGFMRRMGIKIAYQCHDEVMFNTKNKEKTKEMIKDSMKMVNNSLKLNIEVGCSIDHGQNYSEIH